jgi:hypothetical protein
MERYNRLIIAFAILLSGLALIPQVGLFAEAVSWQRYVGVYEEGITVTRAQYLNQELEVRVTYTNRSLATLEVYKRSTNELIGPLSYDSNSGEYVGTFPLAEDPGIISVRSDLGQESSVFVTEDSGPPPSVVAELHLPIILR